MNQPQQPTVTLHLDSRHPDHADTRATRHALDAAAVPYRVIDLAHDPGTATSLWHEGLRDLPVLTCGASAWTGYQPDRLAALTRLFTPTLVELAPADPMDALQCDSCQ